MNPNYIQYQYPLFPGSGICSKLAVQDPVMLNLLEQIFVYDPIQRPSALEALNHVFFEDMRKPQENLEGVQDLFSSPGD
jgi:serine/threonine protein kinase